MYARNPIELTKTTSEIAFCDAACVSSGTSDRYDIFSPYLIGTGPTVAPAGVAI